MNCFNENMENRRNVQKAIEKMIPYVKKRIRSFGFTPTWAAEEFFEYKRRAEEERMELYFNQDESLYGVYYSPVFTFIIGRSGWAIDVKHKSEI